MAKFDEEKTERRLSLLRRKEAEQVTELLAAKYKLPYLDLSAFPIDTDAIKIVPEGQARTGELAVFQAAGSRLKIAVRDPNKNETGAVLKGLENQRYIYELYLVSRPGLERAWQIYGKIPPEHEASAGAIAISPAKLASLKQEIHSIQDLTHQVEQRFFANTSEALEVILAGALATEASDVHVEPQEKGVRLRLRLDGILHDTSSLPLKLYNLLLSRIKLISELKLNIHDRAQDGRFTIQMDRAGIEVRTSILPGPNGENIVLRILNPRSIEISLGDLGLQPWVAAAIEKELKKPNGLILTTGPTGSGKTTTLYTFLGAIHTPEIKIITIEDPIEYRLTGIQQTQVDPDKGYDFANGLRAIVRQDPDVILVGEIRDLETAETAMHASLTGHLVFSTLHTNDASGTIPRLIDLGVRPAIIAPAINVAMAQRLVRKLCTSCRVAQEKQSQMRTEIKKELALLPAGVPIPKEDEWTIFGANPDGCAACNGIGYKSRTGVYEIILIDDKVESLILGSASESAIKKEAFAQGQIIMRQDGLLKVLTGITDLAELERVVGV